jgi:5'(3')-deoxyribonucleotidase
MNICIDFDDTLIYSKICKYASQILGYNYTRKDIETWDLKPFPQNLKDLMYRMFSFNYYMNDTIKPIKGSQEKVNEWLKSGHNVYIITARVAQIREKTIEKVNELFPNVTGLRFVDFNESKISILKELGADVWIDDAPHGIIDSLNAGIKTIMICNEYTKYNHHLISLGALTIVEDITKIQFYGGFMCMDSMVKDLKKANGELLEAIHFNENLISQDYQYVSISTDYDNSISIKKELIYSSIEKFIDEKKKLIKELAERILHSEELN